MKVVVVTALPLRLYGNQSLKRFVTMFLDRGDEVVVISDGSDENGEHDFQHDLLTYVQTSAPGVAGPNVNAEVKNRISESHPFEDLRVNDKLMAFGKPSFIVAIKNWLKLFRWFLLNLSFYRKVRLNKALRSSDLIVAYETGRSLAAEMIAKNKKLPLLGKYQGTVLKAVYPSILKSIAFFPESYFGIRKADLVVMVNDGTDGDYFCRRRGVRNIYFPIHGVLKANLEGVHLPKEVQEAKSIGKKVLFHCASGSVWKRPDRVISALKTLSRVELDKLVVFSTYFGPGRTYLEKILKNNDLEKSFVFLEKLSSEECQGLIRVSDGLISVNDMSNLGNPVLESAFFGIPIISLDDNSVQPYINNYSGLYTCAIDENLSFSLGREICGPHTKGEGASVNTLKEAQESEYDIIKAAL